MSNGLAVATVSAPHHPPRLMLATVPASSSGSWDWTPVTALDADLSSLPLAADALSNMRCEVLDIKPTAGDDSLPMQAVVQVGVSAHPARGRQPQPSATYLFLDASTWTRAASITCCALDFPRPDLCPDLCAPTSTPNP